jgi:hypothetical protein
MAQARANTGFLPARPPERGHPVNKLSAAINAAAGAAA